MTLLREKSYYGKTGVPRSQNLKMRTAKRWLTTYLGPICTLAQNCMTKILKQETKIVVS